MLGEISSRIDVAPESSQDLLAPEGFETGLCAYLSQHRKLDERGLRRAQRATNGSPGKLVEALAQLGIVSERDLVEAIAAITGLSIAQPQDYPQQPVLAELLSARFLRDAVAIPIDLDDRQLVIAMTNPTNQFAIDAIELATSRRVIPKIGTSTDIIAALERTYGGSGTTSCVNHVNGTDGATNVDIDRLRDLASEAPIVKFVDQLIARAGAEKASDIH